MPYTQCFVLKEIPPSGSQTQKKCGYSQNGERQEENQRNLEIPLFLFEVQNRECDDQSYKNGEPDDSSKEQIEFNGDDETESEEDIIENPADVG